MPQQLPAVRPSEQIQRLSLGPVTAGVLVVMLGLWLLERGQEPTQMIWLGVLIITLPWLPLVLHLLAAWRRYSDLPEVKILDAFGPILAPAVDAHGMPATLRAVQRALAEMGEQGDLRVVQRALAEMGGEHGGR